ncbi:MAG: DUF4242 domain-containing protein [Chitinophagaceae bacterium]|nr:DUF4242 domain-containing protein [Chitinophagaceae bacterium]
MKQAVTSKVFPLHKIAMKLAFVLLIVSCSARASSKTGIPSSGQDSVKPGNQLYIDVHYLAAGKVKLADVAAAHSKDLAVQDRYGVSFLKYWVNEDKGVIYCLSSAPNSDAVQQTHKEAHGLLAANIFAVSPGAEAAAAGNDNFFLDVHTLGAGNVTAAAVAKAHEKDLAVQGKYGVNFLNYWVDEKEGVVLCLSQAKDSAKVISTHREAHGLLPTAIYKVKQRQ